MIVYIKDKITDEVIFKSDKVYAVYGNEIIFDRQKDAKALADALSNSILYLVHREAKHFISYTAEIDHAIINLNKNLIPIAFESDNTSYNSEYVKYNYNCNKFINEIKNT